MKGERSILSTALDTTETQQKKKIALRSPLEDRLDTS